MPFGILEIRQEHNIYARPVPDRESRKEFLDFANIAALSPRLAGDARRSACGVTAPRRAKAPREKTCGYPEWCIATHRRTVLVCVRPGNRSRFMTARGAYARGKRHFRPSIHLTSAAASSGLTMVFGGIGIPAPSSLAQAPLLPLRILSTSAASLPACPA